MIDLFIDVYISLDLKRAQKGFYEHPKNFEQSE